MPQLLTRERKPEDSSIQTPLRNNVVIQDIDEHEKHKNVSSQNIPQNEMSWMEDESKRFFVTQQEYIGSLDQNNQNHVENIPCEIDNFEK